LIVGKVYRVRSDKKAAKDDFVRLVDDTGEVYLFHVDRFEVVPRMTHSQRRTMIHLLWRMPAIIVAAWLFPGTLYGEPPKEGAPPAGIRTDQQGDPLPPGAVARMGAVRFRHTGEVSSLAFFPSGKVLASTSGGAVHLWEVPTGELLATMGQNEGYHRSIHLAISPDGGLLASMNFDNTVGIFDLNTRKELRTFPAEGTFVEFSPDGAVLGAGDRLMDMTSNKEIRKLAGQFWAFSPDSKMLLCASTDPESPGRRLITLREVATDKVVAKRHASDNFVFEFPTFFADSKKIAVGRGEAGIEILDSLNAKGSVAWDVRGQRIASLGFSPDGKRLVSAGDRKLIALDAGTGKILYEIDGRGEIGPHAFAFSRDGKTLAAGWGPEIRLADAATGMPLPRAAGPAGLIHALAFSPSGDTLVTGAEDGSVFVWETATGKPLRELKGHVKQISAVAFSPDGKVVATAGWEANLNVWDPAAGTILREFRQEIASCLAFAPDGKTLAAGYWDKKIRLLDITDGKLLRIIDDHRGRLETIAFSRDGKMLAAASEDVSRGFMSTRHSLRLWDASTGREAVPLTGHQGLVHALAFSPDGKTLATIQLASSKPEIRLWDTVNGKLIRRWEVQPHGLRTCLAFLPDGKTLVSVDSHAVRIWDVSSGKERSSFKSSQPFIWQMTVSADGKRVATAGGDGTVLVWDLAYFGVGK
jgi:WD40 repeat protein